MSFRELRNCAEMLRALGFTRLISIENFRNPNFPLVAEILLWLSKRFDPNADLPTEIDSEQDRIIFIRSAAQFMALNSNVKMNTKKLYQADGYAVQEILKALMLLYSALQSNDRDFKSLDEEGQEILNFDVTSKIPELKHIRGLASEITNKGATLFQLLRREVDLRESRMLVMNRQLELTDVEQGITSAIKAEENEHKKFQTVIDEGAHDENGLLEKIEKKKVSLERSCKRLLTLKKVRPAFMDEYEKLEIELKKNYDIFIKRFMSLAFFEQQLKELDRMEQVKMEEKETKTRGLIERMKLSETAAGLGSLDDESESDDDEDDDDDDDDDDDMAIVNAMARDKQKALVNKGGTKGKGRVFGSMTGADLDSDSMESDSEFNTEAGRDSEVGGKRSQLEGEGDSGPGARRMAPKSVMLDQAQSEDDF